MRRFAIDTLKHWLNKNDRKPLIIRGARQVGKSTLVRIFCEENKLDLIEVNLEKSKLRNAENQDFDISILLDEIQLKYKKSLQKNSLIFLDEIQEQPRLLKMLRYFYEERPEIAVIAAGSLLEIALETEKFSFPVGRVEFLHLGPMTFLEYLIATENINLYNEILKLNFSAIVVSLAQEEFKKYLFIGGMPQAIKSYMLEKSLASVRTIHEQIIQTYRADFPKYNSKINSNRIQRIFLQGASQVSKKVIYQKFDSESQSRDIRRVVELLVDAKVFLPCFHCDGNSSPLIGEVDYQTYKIYFLDVGLMNCILELDFDLLDTEFKNEFNTKGAIAEQFVAQHLYYIKGLQNQPQLFYWLKDKGTQKAEIDFLIEKKGQIIPVEVKSRASGHLKSLFYFIKEKKKALAIKLALGNFKIEKINHIIDNQKVESILIHLPIWAVEVLSPIIKQYNDKT